MIEKIMKAVKSSNKKRSRNITIGAVVGFLLSCTAVMGAGDYLWIGENSGEIKFNIQKTTQADGSDGDWKVENPYEEITWNADTKTYTNNMTLSSSEVNGKDTNGYLSYGLRLSGNLNDMNFVNNGSITGEASNSSYGYGIYNSAEIGNIENKGIINGFGTGDSGSLGYGISNKSATMGNIENKGIISSTATSSRFETRAYGIYNYSLVEMGNIENEGIISGTGNNNNSTASGYGIYIYNYNSTGKDITNKGIISGSGTRTNGVASGYGIYSSTAKIGNITNTGVIYGKTNVIKRSSGDINTAYNYGILVNGNDGEKVVDGLTIVDRTSAINQILNKGLIFKALDTGGYKADKDEYGKFGATFDNDAGIKIINAKAEGTEDNITGTESLKLENGILTYTDSANKDQVEIISSSKRYILNGITDTLKVSGKNNELNGSVINAYGTAVVFGDTGDKELTLSGTIVNGGIDGSAAISGSDDTDNGDTLILQSMASNGGTQNTIVNGNINMGAGADTLTIGDGTIINGILDGGDSNSKDTLNFGISSGAKSNSSDSQEIKIMHSIYNFENINVEKNTNVTLFEKTVGANGKEIALEVSGVEEINIKQEEFLI